MTKNKEKIKIVNLVITRISIEMITRINNFHVKIMLLKGKILYHIKRGEWAES